MKQDYSTYTSDDHQIWRVMSDFCKYFNANVSSEFKEGLKKLNLSYDKVQDLDVLNKKLVGLTGWRYKAVTTAISNAEFFQALSEKVFLSAVTVRAWEEISFCKSPDIFHDVYGHAAMLTNVKFAAFLENLGRLATLHSENEQIMQALSRLYWYTAEAGLIWENGKLNFYGGGIVTSFSEHQRAFSGAVTATNFDLQQIIDAPYDSLFVSNHYFIINSLDELSECLADFIPMVDSMQTVSK